MAKSWTDVFSALIESRLDSLSAAMNARAQGRTLYPPPPPESADAFPPAIKGLLVAALKRPDDPGADVGPFAVQEAARHRALGFKLEEFLFLMKDRRDACLDLLGEGTFAPEARQAAEAFVLALFDRMEIEALAGWAPSSNEGDGARAFRERNLHIQKERKRLGAVLDGLGMPVALIGGDDGVIYANAPMNDAFTKFREDPSGLLSKLDPKPGTQEQTLETPNGERHFEILVKPASENGGDERIAIFLDVTVRRQTAAALERHHAELQTMFETRTNELASEIALHSRAERKLRKALDQLSSSNSELARFAYVSSHELLQPVVSVEGFARILQEEMAGRMDPELRDIAKTIAEESTRIHSMIKALRVYSGLDIDKRPFGPVDLNAIVEGVIEDMADAVGEAGATIKTAALPEIRGDASLIFSLIRHLISNSLKFRDPVRPCRISIEGGEKGPNWLVSVADNGIGVPEHEQDSIFLAYKRLHPRADYPGEGMGLALCKGIMERHGGDIRMLFDDGEGATVRLLFPMEHSQSLE